MGAIWLLIGAALIALEMLTLTFYLLWIGVGAWVAAAVAFLYPGNLTAQLVTGASAAFLCMLLSKPLARRLRQSRGYRDRIEDMVGLDGFVLEPIRPGRPGLVRVSGETWSAVAGEFLPAGEKIVVTQRGTTMLEVRRREGES